MYVGSGKENVSRLVAIKNHVGTNFFKQLDLHIFPDMEVQPHKYKPSLLPLYRGL